MSACLQWPQTDCGCGLRPGQPENSGAISSATDPCFPCLVFKVAVACDFGPFIKYQLNVIYATLKTLRLVLLYPISQVEELRPWHTGHSAKKGQRWEGTSDPRDFSQSLCLRPQLLISPREALSVIGQASLGAIWRKCPLCVLNLSQIYLFRTSTRPHPCLCGLHGPWGL